MTTPLGTITETSAASEPAQPQTAAQATRPGITGFPRWARALLLTAVFVCAGCGLVYELALVALGSYLIGDAVGQASVVLSVMVFAMGIGSLGAKPLQRRAATAFVMVELLLALTGGMSVLGLYAAFAWLDLYTPALIITAFVVGALIGAEIPLLMTLLQRVRPQDAGSAVADLFAADYVGALVGGLAFPFILLPTLGLIRGALAVGIVNAIAGTAVILGLFRPRKTARESLDSRPVSHELSQRTVFVLVGAAILTVGALTVAAAGTAPFEVSARQALYDDPVVHAERSTYQDIVLTRSVALRSDPDLRLFLNGDLQFSSRDEYRYHEALVHPAMATLPDTCPERGCRVLVLGGGDGLATREVLRYPEVREVVLVELDPAVVRLARRHPDLRALNAAALDDPRVRVVTVDAFTWLRGRARDPVSSVYDAIVVDLPDPDATATAKLYSVEFYSLARRALTPGGRLVVQAGSPYFAPDAFWCVAATVRAAGLSATPYHIDVPSFGDWGFILAANDPPRLRLADHALPLRFLDGAVLGAAAVFPRDRGPRTVPPSTLTSPRVLEYQRAGWQDY